MNARRSHRTHRGVALLAPAVALVAVVLAAGTAVPAAAAVTDGAEITAVSTDAGYRAAPARVPVVESQLGVGAALSGGERRSVTLPGAAGAQSALVRLSAFDAAGDTVVDDDGSAALAVEAGGSASTTVLAPLTWSHPWERAARPKVAGPRGQGRCLMLFRRP